MKSARNKAAVLQFVGEVSVGVGCYVWGGFTALVGYVLGWATVLIFLFLSAPYIEQREDGQ